MSDKPDDSNKTILDEINDIEKKKNKIDIALKELNEFGIKLKGSLLCEEQNMEEKKQNILKEKKKRKK